MHLCQGSDRIKTYILVLGLVQLGFCSGLSVFGLALMYLGRVWFKHILLTSKQVKNLYNWIVFDSA